jgi:hypothetical protein
MAEKKQHKIVSATTGEQVKKPAAKKTADKPVIHEAAPVGNASGLRIGAIVLWVVALIFEVLALLVVLGKVNLKFMPTLWQLILFLVLDLICVIIGAQLWKKANHIQPASNKNSFKFWLWNNMGVIVCCFAFIPFLIYVLFIDKEADPKMKKVASIVAAVALVLGIGISYDWNPVSAEGKAQAEATLAGQSVYWTQFGTVYHLDQDCQHLNRSSELFEGDVATAIGNNKTRLCKTCAKNFSIEIDDNGAITSLASSFAAPEEPADEPAA